MKIKNVETKSNVFLAPMAGVTSKAFRTICHEMGAGLCYAEMVSDKGLTYNNQKTLDMLEVEESEHPISMQIFGSEAKELLDAAKVVLKKTNIDILDINMGCPVKKVVTNGAGSALMKTPEKIYDIVHTLTSELDIPVTIKIRTGWDHLSINCVEVAKLAEKAGASAIAIHGRTRSDLYLNTSDLDLIKAVKEAVSIPVIGNGDIVDIYSAKKMFDYTHVDAIMIGRAALGNPWIFKEINAYLKDGTIIERPSKKEILDIMLRHARGLEEQKGTHTAMVEMRTQAAYYLKNFIGSKSYKVQVVEISTYAELEKIAEEILNDETVIVKK